MGKSQHEVNAPEIIVPELEPGADVLAVRDGYVNAMLTFVERGEFGLKGFPLSLRRVVESEAWRERKTVMSGIVSNPSFAAFVTAKPPTGIGSTPAQLRKLCHDDSEALTMLEEALAGKPGGDRKSEAARIKVDNGNLDPAPKVKGGNRRSYTLRRLKNERPDLHARVVAKELSAHRAAIEAGFRKERTPLEWLNHWWAKASAKERRAFLRGTVEN